MSIITEKTDFERGFALILKTFLKYSSNSTGGSNDKLEKDEMEDLIKTEFGGLLTQCNASGKVDEIFQKFDEDNSESVDFVEFLKVVAQLASDSNIVQKIADGEIKGI